MNPAFCLASMLVVTSMRSRSAVRGALQLGQANASSFAGLCESAAIIQSQGFAAPS